MMQSEHDAQLRQQIFLFAIGIFLVAYLVSLYRYRSFEWAMVTSSIAFGVTVVAGAVLAAVINVRDDEPESVASAPAGVTARGNVVGFRSNGDDFDQEEQAAD